jgi:hypothetical protein
MAVSNVVRSINNGDVSVSQWWLTRMRSTEFGNRIADAITTTQPVVQINLSFKAPEPAVEAKPFRLIEGEAQVIPLKRPEDS